jgi:hypothetical protein
MRTNNVVEHVLLLTGVDLPLGGRWTGVGKVGEKSECYIGPLQNIGNTFSLDHGTLGGQAVPHGYGVRLSTSIARASMVRYLANTYRVKRSSGTDAVVRCPKCAAHAKFSRTLLPHIDACGFESYSFRCEFCGSAIGGIINPVDDKLFVALLDPAIDTTALSTRGRMQSADPRRISTPEQPRK